MEAVWQSVLAGVPFLVLHVIVAVAILIIGIVVYIWITPWEDWRLVREGNTAAAIAMGGMMLGLGIPLASCLKASVNVWDILIWGLVTLVLQVVTFKVMDLLMRGLARRIEDGQVSAAIVLAAAKLSVAAIIAAAVAG
jgi:putative membrane protein